LHKKVSPCLSIPFSDANGLVSALFWDRMRLRLPSCQENPPVATLAGEDACGPRRARPLVRWRHWRVSRFRTKNFSI